MLNHLLKHYCECEVVNKVAITNYNYLIWASIVKYDKIYMCVVLGGGGGYPSLSYSQFFSLGLICLATFL